MIYLSTRRQFSWLDWGDGGAAGKLKRAEGSYKEQTWPQFWREGIKKITIALVPTTLKGNKWLFNISMHTKKKEKKKERKRERGKKKSWERWWIKQKEATRKGCSSGGGVFVRQRGNMQHVKSRRLFYLMGAAAVMHPCGPHFSNWTDIGAAPAGSPNHRRSFEQTSVTLRHRGTANRKKKKNTDKRGRGKKKEKRKGCIRGGEHGLGLQSNEHISTEASTDSQFENCFLS